MEKLERFHANSSAVAHQMTFKSVWIQGFFFANNFCELTLFAA